jgi:hypothetical protein
MGFIAQLQLSEAYSLPKAENWARYVPRKRSCGTLARAKAQLGAGGDDANPKNK